MRPEDITKQEIAMSRVQSHFPGRPAPNALMIELLEWLAARPRTYGEAMEAWRTSCPRMPVWEDALDGGLIRVVFSQDVAMNDAAVHITASGRALLDGRM
jgi:hypothetical protein